MGKTKKSMYKCRHSCGCRGKLEPALLKSRARHEKNKKMHPKCNQECQIFAYNLPYINIQPQVNINISDLPYINIQPQVNIQEHEINISEFLNFEN